VDTRAIYTRNEGSADFRSGLRWLVLHHEPPPFPEHAQPGESEAKALIEEYLPDFWLSGHVHDSPYKLGGKGCHELGTTIVLTRGQILEGPRPNHIELDTESGKIEWRSIQETRDRITSAVL
jgi:Icc-related predicted phosphoesterase